MLIYELSGFHLAKQLVRIAADIACAHFVQYDFALWIDDKSTSFCETGVFDVDIQLLRQFTSRVADHRILDLADCLRRFMPCFVNKVGITGNRINFTSDSLEISILALQVFKLGRAHKGEVRRIEEEHAPLAEKILIGDFDEIVLLECIQFEFANFFTV